MQKILIENAQKGGFLEETGVRIKRKTAKFHFIGILQPNQNSHCRDSKNFDKILENAAEN
jgi:hypothetical protein